MEFTKRRMLAIHKREFISEDASTKTYIVREKKFAFHAFCVHKPTGMEVEQASANKAQAIRLAEWEMKLRLKEGKLKTTKEKS